MDSVKGPPRTWGDPTILRQVGEAARRFKGARHDLREAVRDAWWAGNATREIARCCVSVSYEWVRHNIVRQVWEVERAPVRRGYVEPVSLERVRMISRRHKNARLALQEKILLAHRNGSSHEAIAQETGYSMPQISRVCRGQRGVGP